MNSLTMPSHLAVSLQCRSTMDYSLIFFIAFLGASAAYESPPRSNRIRFPSEENISPQRQFGPQMFTSESQDVVVTLGGPNMKGNTYNFVPQVLPPNIKTIREENNNNNGFPGGVILHNYQQPMRQQDEFYHPVPPPMLASPYGPPKSVIHGNKPVQMHPNQFLKMKRQPERHRFAPQRFNQNHPNQGKPFTGNPPKQLFNPAQYLKEQKQPKPEAIYKYTSVTRHVPQKNHNKEVENDHPQIYNKQVVQNIRPQFESHIEESSEEFPDYDQPMPYWQMREEDKEQSYNNDRFKQPAPLPHQHPNREESKHHFYKSPEDSYSYESTEEFVDNINKYSNKRYIPLKEQHSDLINIYKNQKKIPIPENLQQQYSLQNKNRKPIEHHAHVKDISEELFSSENLQDQFKYLPHHFDHISQLKKTNLGNKLVSGSEWIPINAPEGTLPAKSYDIPAPDLSKGFSEYQRFGGGFLKEKFEPFNTNVENIQTNQRPSNVVYGGRKKIGNEEVVSASVMVKQ